MIRQDWRTILNFAMQTLRKSDNGDARPQLPNELIHRILINVVEIAFDDMLIGHRSDGLDCMFTYSKIILKIALCDKTILKLVLPHARKHRAIAEEECRRAYDIDMKNCAPTRIDDSYEQWYARSFGWQHIQLYTTEDVLSKLENRHKRSGIRKSSEGA